MNQPGLYRPGDRSRREDDRYLFLEALLSAREQLTLSWVGRNARDNSEQMPSVLVGQFMDYLDARFVAPNETGDSQAATEVFARHHALQPFHARYFKHGQPLSYCEEWRMPKAPALVASATLPRFRPTDWHAGQWPLPSHSTPNPLEGALTVQALAQVLKSPEQVFLRGCLQARLIEPNSPLLADEPFELSGLERWQVMHTATSALLEQERLGHSDDAQLLHKSFQRLQGQGALPWGQAGVAMGAQLQQALQRMLYTRNELLTGRHMQHVALAMQVDDLLVQGPWVDLAAADGPALCVMLSESRLQGSKPGDIAYTKLFKPWVTHVLLNALYPHTKSVWLHPNGALHFKGLPQAESQHHVVQLVQAYRQAQIAPLPFEPNTGFALIRQPKRGQHTPDQIARMQLQWAEEAYLAKLGDTTAASHNRALALLWPNVNSLLGSGIQQWAQHLLQPLVECVQIGTGEEQLQDE